MKIQAPTTCPSCASKLVLVNDQLFCRNSACEAQSVKRIEHFCKSVGLKGFGPKTLEKLAFDSVLDVFTFSESYYVDTLGDTVGKKLFLLVKKAKESIELKDALAGLSIPLFGETASAKLCSHISSVEDIGLKACKDAGLGEKVTNNLLDYVASEEYNTLYKLLKGFGNKKVSKKSDGLRVCITGKLDDYKNRSEAASYLESLGYTVVDSVTKTTDILVNEEDKESAKLTKALALGIRIATIKELKGN